MPNTAQTAAPANNSNSAADVRKFDITIKRTQVIVNPESGYTSVDLSIDKPVPGFVKDDAGNFVPQDVDHISFTRGSLTRQLAAINDDFATLRDCSETAFSRKIFAVLLRGAKMTIKRTLHHQGEVVDGREEPLARDQWFTEVEKVQFTDKALAKLDLALSIDL